ncbi:hypothetical protein [Exiguobacterium sp. ZOR0005]|nr:hypothetical protein [Exiguobacterium sp. ZOR0005]
MYKILVAGQPDYLKAHAASLAEPFMDRVTGMFTAAVLARYLSH